jgi:hypothetical protein
MILFASSMRNSQQYLYRMQEKCSHKGYKKFLKTCISGSTEELSERNLSEEDMDRAPDLGQPNLIYV